MKYRLPRLVGLGQSLSRLGGGIGTRGPGETRLEVDRRRVRKRIDDLEGQLAELKRQRDMRRARREKQDKTVVALVGYTNAGKSTLLNALYGFGLQTGDVSRKIERGRHTTRHCELIPLEGGGMALDTPGFSLLETKLCDPVLLKDGYPEFAPYEGQCRFSPCYHLSEPGCAVLKAARAGEISQARLERYHLLLKKAQEAWRNRYD